jgi:hypothetical protein
MRQISCLVLVFEFVYFVAVKFKVLFWIYWGFVPRSNSSGSSRGLRFFSSCVSALRFSWPVHSAIFTRLTRSWIDFVLPPDLFSRAKFFCLDYFVCALVFNSDSQLATPWNPLSRGKVSDFHGPSTGFHRVHLFDLLACAPKFCIFAVRS